MKMRAKMIDGTPVTFESTDSGLMYALGENAENGFTSDRVMARRWRFVREVAITEFVGEGFYARCVTGAHNGSEFRLEKDRLVLEQAGVDTATVEYRAYDFCAWEALWPELYRHPANVPPAPNFWDGQMPGNPSFTDRVTKPLVDSLKEMTSHTGIWQGTPMTNVGAGCAALHEILQNGVVIEDGRIRVVNPQRAVSLIYRAMRGLKP